MHTLFDTETGVVIIGGTSGISYDLAPYLYGARFALRHLRRRYIYTYVCVSVSVWWGWMGGCAFVCVCVSELVDDMSD